MPNNYSNEMLGQNYVAKPKYLFLIHINNIPTFLATKAARPTQSNAEMQLNFLNTKRWQAGKTTWQPINVTITDAYTPSGAQMVMAWLRAKHESITGRDGWPSSYMRNIVIELLPPDGGGSNESITAFQKWTLINAWVTNANFGQLDHADENTPLEIQLTIRYDKAILEY